MGKPSLEDHHLSSRRKDESTESRPIYKEGGNRCLGKNEEGLQNDWDFSNLGYLEGKSTEMQRKLQGCRQATCPAAFLRERLEEPPTPTASWWPLTYKCSPQLQMSIWPPLLWKVGLGMETNMPQTRLLFLCIFSQVLFEKNAANLGKRKTKRQSSIILTPKDHDCPRWFIYISFLQSIILYDWGHTVDTHFNLVGSLNSILQEHSKWSDNSP